jgi:hypothetical protein
MPLSDNAAANAKAKLEGRQPLAPVGRPKTLYVTRTFREADEFRLAVKRITRDDYLVLPIFACLLGSRYDHIVVLFEPGHYRESFDHLSDEVYRERVKRERIAVSQLKTLLTHKGDMRHSSNMAREIRRLDADGR